MQQKSAAADAAALRLNQGQHHLHGDGRIGGTAAGFEHLVARVGGQRVGGSNGKFFSRPTRFFGVAGAAFGLRGRVVGEAWRGGAAAEQSERQGDGSHEGHGPSTGPGRRGRWQAKSDGSHVNPLGAAPFVKSELLLLI